MQRRMIPGWSAGSTASAVSLTEEALALDSAEKINVLLKSVPLLSMNDPLLSCRIHIISTPEPGSLIKF